MLKHFVFLTLFLLLLAPASAAIYQPEPEVICCIEYGVSFDNISDEDCCFGTNNS